ncbi:MAG: hypothetical protein IJS56_04010 [Bacilli bacterium]|nr:hypothetical protein [Bacilli bacterium]
MKFTDEDFDSMTADLDLINLLLDQFKKDLTEAEIDKLEILKKEKEFLILGEKQVKLIKREIKPELNKIIAAEAGKGAYYPFYSEPLSINNEIMNYENSLKNHGEYNRKYDKHLSEEEKERISLMIEDLRSDYEESDKNLREYLDYSSKVIAINNRVFNTRYNIKVRLALNYLEELKFKLGISKPKEKNRSLKK